MPKIEKNIPPFFVPSMVLPKIYSDKTYKIKKIIESINIKMIKSGKKLYKIDNQICIMGYVSVSGKYPEFNI
jgi:hypothetical protein